MGGTGTISFRKGSISLTRLWSGYVTSAKMKGQSYPNYCSSRLAFLPRNWKTSKDANDIAMIAALNPMILVS